MKILEIIQHQYSTGPHDEPEDDSYSETDRGHFSVVKTSKDPFMVNKYNHNTAERDGFDAYAEEIVAGKLWEKSTYFPRIYKTNTDMNGQRSWEIEKLFPNMTITTEHVRSIVESIFNKEAIEEANIQIEVDSKMWILDRIAGLIARRVKNNRTEGIIDEQLETAMRILSHIKDKHKVSVDIHGANIMIRRSPSIQLVLNDPFSFYN